MDTARSRFDKRSQTSSLDRPIVTACVRCRQRKKRCDHRYPKCTLCETAQVDCVVQDGATKRTVPKSYVHNLEERVAFLELKLQEYGIDDYDVSTPTSPSQGVVPLPQSNLSAIETETARDSSLVDPNLSAAAQNTLDEVLSLLHNRGEHKLAFPKFLLTEIMRSKATPQVAPAYGPPSCRETAHLFNMVNDLETSPAPLPNKKGALYLTTIYFEFANDSYPLMHERIFRDKLEQLYASSESADPAGVHVDEESGLTIFFAFMVFAVALLALQKNDVSGVSKSLCERYHTTALRALKDGGLPANVEGVQALLLMSQYSYHHRSIHEAWRTISMALRLSVGLGLHRDPPVGKLDFLTLDTLRRTFWVAYAMDRTIAITLGLPSCLSDGAITAKFPSDVDDEFIGPEGIHDAATATRGLKRYSLHLLRYRQFQSEMQTVLYDETYPALPRVDYIEWQKSMYERIKAWYDYPPRDHMPGGQELKTVLRPDMWELAFNRALLYLYRPSPRIPSLSDLAFATLAESSLNVIHLYRRIFLENRVTILWQAVENLFSAGTSLLYSYVNSAQVQQNVNLRSLEANTHMCSSILWGMVERVPEYKSKRDAFDTIVAKTLAGLTPDAGSRNDSPDHGSASMHEDGEDYNNAFSGSRNDHTNNLSTRPVAARNSSTSHVVSQHSAPVSDQFVQPLTARDAYVLDTRRDIFKSNPPFPDQDEMAIDWEAFENTNMLRQSTQFLSSTWL